MYPAAPPVTAARSIPRRPRVWSVTLAGQNTDGRLRYYTVPVTANTTFTTFTGTGTPGRVAGPACPPLPPRPTP
ncbi:hypothetical protein ABZZ74_43395 [Streptomyces sp. NPDC006476]|uniref:hypothetical protein n=1 Tax=Streptomyces sp. NPDC006476 TaxID=3157175 RepID=UPI00339F1652